MKAISIVAGSGSASLFKRDFQFGYVLCNTSGSAMNYALAGTAWDENWYSSPAVFDIDKDGTNEIIASRHSVLYVWKPGRGV